MRFPFAASRRDPDEFQHAEPVSVLAVDHVDERRGVLLRVKRLLHDGKQRCLLAEQPWADDEGGANAVVLGDYRYWVNRLDGLTPGFD